MWSIEGTGSPLLLSAVSIYLQVQIVRLVSMAGTDTSEIRIITESDGVEIDRMINSQVEVLSSTNANRRQSPVVLSVAVEHCLDDQSDDTSEERDRTANAAALGPRFSIQATEDEYER